MSQSRTLSATIHTRHMLSCSSRKTSSIVCVISLNPVWLHCSASWWSLLEVEVLSQFPTHLQSCVPDCVWGQQKKTLSGHCCILSVNTRNVIRSHHSIAVRWGWCNNHFNCLYEQTKRKIWTHNVWWHIIEDFQPFHNANALQATYSPTFVSALESSVLVK